METLVKTATAALAATTATSTATTVPDMAAHNGIAPAAAMPTPFDFPCGINFLSNEFHQNKNLRDVCGPPNFDAYWWSTVGYYSPAVCPRGYTAGCFRWNSAQGPPVEPTETAVQCVPRGYKCQNNDISVAFSGTNTAPMIQIRWASTDLSTLATHPLFPGANPTNTEEDYLKLRTKTANLQGRAKSSGAYYTSTSSDDSGSGSSGSDRLSAGAKAGIGIGVSLGAILGFTTLGLIIWRVRTSSRRSQEYQTHPPPQMVQSQYATAPPGAGPPPGMGGGPIPMGGPSPEQYYGGQPPAPQAMQPVYYQQHQQQQHHPSASEVDNTSTANSNWAGSSVTPPPAAAIAAERGIGGVAAAGTGSSSMGSPHPPPSELESARTPNPPVEMGSGSPAVHYAQPATSEQQQQQQQSARPAAADPQSFVGAPPVEPSAEELSSLREQHSQLEQRRQRILELERIEQEQEALRNRMSKMHGGGQGQSQHELP